MVDTFQLGECGRLSPHASFSTRACTGPGLVDNLHGCVHGRRGRVLAFRRVLVPIDSIDMWPFFIRLIFYDDLCREESGER